MKGIQACLLALGLLHHDVFAQPANEPRQASQTMFPEASSMVIAENSTATSIPAVSVAALEVAASSGEVAPDSLIYEAQTDNSHFEVGADLAAALNKLSEEDERCHRSQEACRVPVKETLDRLASSGKYYERRDVEGKFEARQGKEVAAPVLVWAYLLHRLWNEPRPKKLDLNVGKPVAVDIPIVEFDPSRTITTVTSSSITPSDRYVMIQTSLATDRKGCSSLSSEIAAIASPKPVIPNLSPFDMGIALPGYFNVVLTKQEEEEVTMLEGVEFVVGPMGKAKPRSSRKPRRSRAVSLDSIPADNSTVAAESGTDEVAKRASPGIVSADIAASNAGSGTNRLAKRGSRNVGNDRPCHKFASWADGQASLPDKYVYEDREGEGYPLYILDDGFLFDHDELSHLSGYYPRAPPIPSGDLLPGTLTWFNGFPKEFETEQMPWTERPPNTDPYIDVTDWNEHGTALLSMIVGQSVGLLPKSRPTLVKYHTGKGISIESAFRRIVFHLTSSMFDSRSPIVSFAGGLEFYREDKQVWDRDGCIWALRIGSWLDILANSLSATLVFAVANDGNPEVPDIFEALALGPTVHLGRCLQHGIYLPHITSIRLVSGVNEETGDWEPNVAKWPGISLVGAASCPLVLGDHIDTPLGASVATAWTAGVLVTIAQKLGNAFRNRQDHQIGLFQRAQELQHRRPGSAEGSPKALWNGLLEFDNRKLKNKALSIILEEMDRDSEKHHWRFYETVQGQKAGCLTQRTSVFEAPMFVHTGIIDTPLPSGEYDFTIWGRGCKWRGDGTNPGKLICDGTEYDCVSEAKAPINVCPDGRVQRAKVYCDFDSDGDSTPAPVFQPGMCSFHMWEEFDFYRPKGRPNVMRFDNVKDANGKEIGGEWGPSPIGTEGTVVIKSQLPAPITIKIFPQTEPRDPYRAPRSLNFNFTYYESEWPHTQKEPKGEGFKQSCRRDSLGGSEREKMFYDCTFSC